MNQENRTKSTNDQRLQTRIYKPLTELKYAYESKSNLTTMLAATSRNFPSIHSTVAQQSSSYPTNNFRYKEMLKEVFKTKLKCGKIYDQIATIERCMNENNEYFERVASNHSNFVNSYEQFLCKQHTYVKSVLNELQHREEETNSLRNRLDDLKQLIIRKSLHIYEKERLWRKYKIEQKFLLHIRTLLQPGKIRKCHYTENFNIDPPSNTPCLDEIIDNFKKHNDDIVFDINQFEHVTPQILTQFMNELRIHNLRLLEIKLKNCGVGGKIDRVGRAKAIDAESNFNQHKCEYYVEPSRHEHEVKITDEKDHGLQTLKKLESTVDRLQVGISNSHITNDSNLHKILYIEEGCLVLIDKLNLATFTGRINEQNL